MGHLLCATGARLVAPAVNQLLKNGGRYQTNLLPLIAANWQ